MRHKSDAVITIRNLKTTVRLKFSTGLISANAAGGPDVELVC